MDNENEIKSCIKTLSRGLMQGNYSIAFSGYKNLYKIGAPAIPALKDSLLSIDWSKSKYKELSKYVAGIFSLIHDIDEAEANFIQEFAAKKGCPQYIQALMKSKCSFSTKNYQKYKCCGVDIFEHKEIKKQCDIQKKIGGWLKTIPEDDLGEISRLYIVRKEEIDENAAGTYTPGLFKIVLLWDSHFKENSLPFKLSSIMIENTLYHEIGHHVHRHTFSQHTSDNEKEADRYAYRIMKKNHPYLHIVARLLNKIGFKSESNYYRWGL